MRSRPRSRAATAITISTAAFCVVAVALSAEAGLWQPETDATEPVAVRPAPMPAPAATPREPAPAPTHRVAYHLQYRDGHFTGPVFSAYYGEVQVQAVIHAGRIERVNVLRYPFHSGTSRSINRQALPYLAREVISAQSAGVHGVSGATLTSRAFIRSMAYALRNAHS